MVFMDDGGHFYSSSDPTFSSWTYTINGSATDLDTWPDIKMALNDEDYGTILALVANPGGSLPSAYVLAPSLADLAITPEVSLGSFASAGSNTMSISCGLTGLGATMLFNMESSPIIAPIKTTNGGSSFSSVSGLPSNQIWYSPAFNQGGGTVLHPTGRRLDL